MKQVGMGPRQARFDATFPTLPCLCGMGGVPTCTAARHLQQKRPFLATTAPGRGREVAEQKALRGNNQPSQIPHTTTPEICTS